MASSLAAGGDGGGARWHVLRWVLWSQNEKSQNKEPERGHPQTDRELRQVPLLARFSLNLGRSDGPQRAKTQRLQAPAAPKMLG
ncbi:MAG: hypothetical protein U1F26_16770 [Lysobacterales bacterium]